MDWLWIFALLGLNSMAYSADVAFLFLSDRFSERYPKLSAFVHYALFVLSLPGVLIFEPATRAHSRRVYDKHINDMKSLRAIAEKLAKPPEWESKIYNWDVEMFVDEYGHFDLNRWKSHEYEKLGL